MPLDWHQLISRIISPWRRPNADGFRNSALSLDSSTTVALRYYRMVRNSDVSMTGGNRSPIFAISRRSFLPLYMTLAGERGRWVTDVVLLHLLYPLKDRLFPTPLRHLNSNQIPQILASFPPHSHSKISAQLPVPQGGPKS